MCLENWDAQMNISPAPPIARYTVWWGLQTHEIMEHCGGVYEVGVQVGGQGERACFTVSEQEIVLETFLSVAAVFRASEKVCLGKFSGISRVPPGSRSSPGWFAVIWYWHRGSRESSLAFLRAICSTLRLEKWVSVRLSPLQLAVPQVQSHTSPTESVHSQITPQFTQEES